MLYEYFSYIYNLKYLYIGALFSAVNFQTCLRFYLLKFPVFFYVLNCANYITKHSVVLKYFAESAFVLPFSVYKLLIFDVFQLV